MPAGRRALSTELAERGVSDDVIQAIELMASELLTNAVLHSDGEIGLRMLTDGNRIRVEVVDRSPSQPVLRDPSDDATSGRGIGIVDALAECWGVDNHPDGTKSVWFEVRA